MQAKQYLRELKRLNTYIAQKEHEKAALYDTLKGGATDTVRVQASKDGDSMTQLIIRIEGITDKINAKIDEYVDLKHRIIDQIQGLDNLTFSDLLYRRYVEDKRLEVISVEMNYSYDYTRQLHGHALQAFERKYKAEITAYEEGKI